MCFVGYIKVPHFSAVMQSEINNTLTIYGYKRKPLVANKGFRLALTFVSLFLHVRYNILFLWLQSCNVDSFMIYSVVCALKYGQIFRAEIN